MPFQSSDKVHHSSATASRRTVPRLRMRHGFAPAGHPVCPTSPALCRRAQNPAARSIWPMIGWSALSDAGSKNIANACVARWRHFPSALPSVATCRSPARRTAIRLGLRRSLPSTIVATAIRVLLLAQQAQSGGSHEALRSGSQLKPAAAPPRPISVLRSLRGL